MDWYKNKKSSSGVNSQLMSGQPAPKEMIVANKKKSTKNQISPSKSTAKEDKGTRFKINMLQEKYTNILCFHYYVLYLSKVVFENLRKCTRSSGWY